MKMPSEFFEDTMITISLAALSILLLLCLAAAAVHAATAGKLAIQKMP